MILYELLTGQVPFEADTPFALIMKHIREPLPPPTSINPDLPEAVEGVILKVLSKEPAGRYPTAGEMVQALREAVGVTAEEALAARPIMTLAPAPELVEVTDRPGPDRTPSPPPVPYQVPVQQPPPFLADREKEAAEVAGSDKDEAVVCPKCRTPNFDYSRLCSHCGQQLIIDCILCHTPNRIDATQCINCRANLERTQAMRQEFQEARRRSQTERDQAFEEKEARQRKEKLQRLVDQLGDPINHGFTIFQLNQFGSEAVEPLIQTLLTDSNPHARYGSAKVLGQICGEYEVKALIKARAARVLIKALADPEPKVRYWAAEALGRLKGQQGQLAVEPLGALLKDSQEEVRQQARQSLQKIGGKRVEEILDKSRGFMSWIKRN